MGWVKKVIIIILVLAVLAGGVFVFLTYRQVDAARQAHLAVLADHQTMVDNAGRTTVTVLERGREVTVLTLEDLGLLEGALAGIDGQFPNKLDLVDEAAFAAQDRDQQIAWAELVQPDSRTVRLSAENLNIDGLYETLTAEGRTAPVSAKLVYDKGLFSVEPEVYGDTLQKDVIYNALAEQAASFEITNGTANSYTFEIPEESYLLPEVTRENTDFDFTQALKEQIDLMDFSVRLGDEAVCGLSSGAVASLLSVTDQGRIILDEEGLRAIISQWAQTYNKHQVKYIMDSYVDGPVEVPFITCNYILDEEALFDAMAPVLRTLQGGQVEAEFLCQDDAGQPVGVGDTYVEVDLTTQVMTFVVDGEVLVSTDIVSGRSWGYATPLGLYKSGNPETNCTLTGDDYMVFVKYWISVTPDNMVGLHDASWRSYFGGNRYVNGGSHGCINTPEAAMKIIFDNIEIGTPILVYHHERPAGSVERPVYITDDSPALWDAFTVRVPEMERTKDSPIEPPIGSTNATPKPQTSAPPQTYADYSNKDNQQTVEPGQDAPADGGTGTDVPADSPADNGGYLPGEGAGEYFPEGGDWDA